jgi:hypothetical protein
MAVGFFGKTKATENRTWDLESGPPGVSVGQVH